MVTIDEIYHYMIFRGQTMPTESQPALNFAITELGEVFDARIRSKSKHLWTRNNPDKEVNVGFEYGDLYQMLQIACVLDTGKSLEENLLEKWESKGFRPDLTK